MIYLHKILPLFLSPIFIVLVLIGIGIFSKKSVPSMLAAILLLLLSTPILSDHLFRYVEKNAVKSSISNLPKASAIVVLSGMLTDVPTEQGVETEWSDPDRFFEGVNLYKANKASRIIFTRGKLPWGKADATEGDVLRKMAMDFGIPDSSIELTKEAQNTRDEATGVRALLNPNSSDIILVTSAFHMPRAQFLFEQEGINVIPYTVDFKVSAQQMTLMDFLPSAHALYLSDIAIRELIGRAYYRFKGLF
jgi:uncharacterized SAM-binding protein YcdF (DUF218 family)